MHPMLWLYRLISLPVLLVQAPLYGWRTRRRSAYDGALSQRLGALPRLPPKRADRRRVQPDLAILTEGECWPEFIAQAQRHNVPVLCITARISDRSFRRMRAGALEDCGAAWRVSDEAALIAAASELVFDPAKRESLGAAGRVWHQANRGALARTLQKIEHASAPKKQTTRWRLDARSSIALIAGPAGNRLGGFARATESSPTGSPVA